MPTISVVMATYNRLAQLRSCLRSISKQTGNVRIQVCVVNDGGPSIASIVAEFPELHVAFRDEATNMGQVSARSLALEMADGEYIALCDDDDRWLPSHLEATLIQLRQAGFIAWGYADAELVGLRWSENEVENEVEMTHRRPFAWKNAQGMLRSYNPIVPSSVIYQKTVHNEIGEYDQNMGHYWDWDLFLRLTEVSSPARTPQCQVLYALDEAGTNQSSIPQRMRSNLLNLIQKHRLEDLPSMNFMGMVESASLRDLQATTGRIWDGNLDIFRS